TVLAAQVIRRSRTVEQQLTRRMRLCGLPIHDETCEGTEQSVTQMVRRENLQTFARKDVPPPALSSYVRQASLHLVARSELG
ncbi:MAG: hypothetical protein AAGJ83_16440, partial [Planctomycetota bacterium]